MTFSAPFRVALCAITYFAAQALAFQFPESFGLVAAIWPAAGIALASLLLNPRRLWPALLGALFVAGLVANLLTERPLLISVGFMIANICETALSAWLLNWWCGATVRFDRVRTVIGLAGAAFLVNSATALIGAGSASLELGNRFSTFYWTWWVANGLGLLLVTPLIVIWARSWRWPTQLKWGRIVELAAILALSGTMTWFIFGTEELVSGVHAMPYLLWGILVVAAIRTGTQGTALYLAVVTSIAVSLTASGNSSFPLGGADAAQQLLSIQVYLGMLGLTGLFLAAAIAEAGERDSLLHALVEGTNDAIYVKDTQGRYLVINSAGTRILGKSAADVIGHDDSDFLSIEEAQAIMRGDQIAMASAEPLTYEERVTDKTGLQHTFLSTKGPVHDEQGEALGLFGIARDITGRKQAEAALREADERFHTMFDRATDGILILTTTGEVVSTNDSFAQMHGFTPEELRGMSLRDLDAPETLRGLPEKMRQVLSGHALHFEVEHYHKDGHIFPLEVAASLFVVDGKPLVQAFHRDITERKRTEALLRSSLHEKESLLKELHHRVKNNLQVITSMTRLEGARSEHTSVAEVVESLQGRIQSMALAHDMLYQAGTIAAVDLGDYIKRLTANIAHTLVVRPGAIRIEVDVVPAAIEMDLATPCGLLVNELLTNCFKHGFPAGHTGGVRIELKLVEGGPQLCLRVSDTGVGFPADFEERRSHSLGMQLVADLAKQLGGTLEITSDQETGTSVAVTFLPTRHRPNRVAATPGLPA